MATSGLGHVERCKAIRTFLSCKVAWVVSKEFKDIENSFNKDEFIHFSEIPSSINKWNILIKKHKINFILIDSYNLSIYLLNKLNKLAKTFVIMDKTPYPNVDLVIVPHPIKTSKNNVFSGSKYSIISSKFLIDKNDNFIQNNNKKNILISFGSLDTINITGQLISELILQRKVYEKRYFFTIILGKFSPNIESIKKQIIKYKFIKLNIQPNNIKDIILSAHFAIGAPGISQIERMYLGLPTILVPQNEIQEPLIKYWKKNKLALNINYSIKNIVTHMININKDELNSIKNNCLKSIDGNGAKRVSEIIKKYMVNDAN